MKPPRTPGSLLTFWRDYCWFFWSLPAQSHPHAWALDFSIFLLVAFGTGYWTALRGDGIGPGDEGCLPYILRGRFAPEGDLAWATDANEHLFSLDRMDNSDRLGWYSGDFSHSLLLVLITGFSGLSGVLIGPWQENPLRRSPKLLCRSLSGSKITTSFPIS